MRDNVNHPKHYERFCSLECIDVMELIFGQEAVFNFCMCNAFKYLWRFRNKNGLEDLNKADWYVRYASNMSLSDEQIKIIVRLSDLLERIVENIKGE